MRTTASEYLNETVRYGGMLVRRGDMEMHLDKIGVEGPARLRFADLPALDLAPRKRYDGDTGVFLTIGNGVTTITVHNERRVI